MLLFRNQNYQALKEKFQCITQRKRGYKKVYNSREAGIQHKVLLSSYRELFLTILFDIFGSHLVRSALQRNSPISHLSPVHPGVHVHVKSCDPGLVVHCASFWQGLLSQPLSSEPHQANDKKQAIMSNAYAWLRKLQSSEWDRKQASIYQLQ